MSLAFEFQRDVSAALKKSQSACPAQVTQRGCDQQSRRFNIYRNNRMVSLIDNLKATYPAVCKLVGDEYFAAVARDYIYECPPVSPVMAEYGGGFSEFIKRSPNAEKIPYIADVASLEWACLQSSHARDSAVLPVDILASFSPEEYGFLCFTPHPSLFFVSSRWAVGSLWSATQNSDAPQLNVESAEHIVVVRPELEVVVQILPASGAALLNSLLKGQPLLEAVTSVIQRDPEFDPGSHLQGLIALGVFSDAYKQG